MKEKKNVLFLCTGNSCRSQMAEGWALALKGELYSFHSAGTKKHGLNPFAIKVMQECGIDLTKHSSKTTSELGPVKMDVVITVCSDAHENCPYFPGGKVIHHGFDDPPRLAKDLEEAEALVIYRRVRDEIKSFIESIEEHLE
jgi:arsenate reductase